MNIKPDGPYSYLNNMVSISSGARGIGAKIGTRIIKANSYMWWMNFINSGQEKS
ncbi:hypothetical protein KHA80_08730 [Anaerobacillus sp. HL2]|nr:hypothetical protein KHA80_08730 [Anaerobacillus sp. HL2]